jgi:hypothetical protein
MFFFTVLRSNRHRLHEPFVRAQLGFLYAGYQKHAWMFELVDLGHKLLVTSLLSFLPTSAQLPTAMSVIVMYVCALCLLS